MVLNLVFTPTENQEADPVVNPVRLSMATGLRARMLEEEVINFVRSVRCRLAASL